MKAIILLFLSAMVFQLGVSGQGNVRLKAKDQTFRLDTNEAYFEIPITITNEFDSSILIPKTPKIYDKLGMAVGEIGIEIIAYDSLRHCAPSYMYLALPEMQTLRKSETKTIIAKVPCSCFQKDEVVNVHYYLAISPGVDKNQLYFRSNKVRLRIK